MAYQVRDAHRSRLGLGLVNQGGEVTVWGFGGSLVGTFATADFLAAVQTELHVRLVPDDAIVIEQKDAVTRAEIADAIHRETSYSTASDHDRRIVARAVDAIYNALSKPSVDEAQVQALADLIDSSPYGASRNTARYMIASGVRIEVTP